MYSLLKQRALNWFQQSREKSAKFCSISPNRFAFRLRGGRYGPTCCTRQQWQENKFCRFRPVGLRYAILCMKPIYCTNKQWSAPNSATLLVSSYLSYIMSTLSGQKNKWKWNSLGKETEVDLASREQIVLFSARNFGTLLYYMHTFGTALMPGYGTMHSCFAHENNIRTIFKFSWIRFFVNFW